MKITDEKEYLLGGTSIFTTEQLAYIRRPTPPNHIKKLQGFAYIPSYVAIDDLNRVTGYNNSVEVKKFEVVGDSVVCHVVIEIFGKNRRDGVGAGDFKRFKEGHAKAGQIVSVGNSYKAAYSNAITNAMSKFGFYRDVYNETFAGESIINSEVLIRETSMKIDESDMDETRKAGAKKVLDSGNLAQIAKTKAYLESLKAQANG